MRTGARGPREVERIVHRHRAPEHRLLRVAAHLCDVKERVRSGLWSRLWGCHGGREEAIDVPSHKRGAQGRGPVVHLTGLSMLESTLSLRHRVSERCMLLFLSADRNRNLRADGRDARSPGLLAGGGPTLRARGGSKRGHRRADAAEEGRSPEIGLDPSTVQRCRKQRDGGADGRQGLRRSRGRGPQVSLLEDPFAQVERRADDHDLRLAAEKKQISDGN